LWKEVRTKKSPLGRIRVHGTSKAVEHWISAGLFDLLLVGDGSVPTFTFISLKNARRSRIEIPLKGHVCC
jgi:hypothetical protein